MYIILLVDTLNEKAFGRIFILHQVDGQWLSIIGLGGLIRDGRTGDLIEASIYTN